MKHLLTKKIWAKQQWHPPKLLFQTDEYLFKITFFPTSQVDFIANKQEFYQVGVNIGREPEERRGHLEMGASI